MGIDRAAFLLSSCSTERKRRKGGEESSSEEEEAAKRSAAGINNFSLDNLEDEVLVEILVRLPTAESVSSSKLVCKRWCFLTSTRYFITHHINEIRDISIFLTKRGCPPIFFVDGSSRLELEFSLEFLPEERSTVSIVASCNDLLFCISHSEEDHNTANANSYICNPFTRQCLLIPAPPKRETFIVGSCFCFFGLVCEPNYQRWAVQGRRQQYESRYRLLRFTKVTDMDAVKDIYCSETGKWNEYLLSGGNYSRLNSNVVAHNGQLYWHTGTGVASYDPFNHGQVIFFDAPDFPLRRLSDSLLSFAHVSVYLGVCQGSLRLMRLGTYYVRPSSNHLSVWELDYETRRLRLTHKIFFNNMFSKDPKVLQILNRRITPRAIAFHPFDKDVVYLGSLNIILSCKLHTGELDFVGAIPYQDINQTGLQVFPVTLPWWPTPVSDAPSNQSSLAMQ